ncbi:uncharacterized protein LOC143046507 [Mytilus galloprovincialis]|uniref:uncharacterized protein LOC143046507 n=1 Tax=Mytilus galloprovincialis TaxID=29158 RepID=UPI003F7B6428
MSGTSKGKQNLVQKLSTQTKDGLKIENQRLCKILNDLKKKYKLTYEVIQLLDQEYEQSKDSMVLRYPQLKDMIRRATTDHVLQQAEMPKIPKHKGVKDLFHSTEGTTQVQQPVQSRSSSFLQTCKQFAGINIYLVMLLYILDLFHSTEGTTQVQQPVQSRSSSFLQTYLFHSTEGTTQVQQPVQSRSSSFLQTYLFHSTEGTTQVQQPVQSRTSSFLQTCKQFAGINIYLVLLLYILDLFHSTEGTTQVQQPVQSRSSSFLQTCKQFAGKSDDSSYEMKTVTRNLSDMHKKEIEDDNKNKEHMISVYENKFLRAHNRLTKLKQEFIASKEDLLPVRYNKLKEMIKTVTKDEKLKPE